MRQGGSFYVLHMDRNGSITAVTDNAGSLVGQQRYTAYGKLTQSGGFPTDRGYTGQIRDGSDSGSPWDFYFFTSRFYNAAIGKFVQPDTIVPGASNPQSLNRYAYALDNPLKLVDPSGHDATDLAWLKQVEDRITHQASAGLNDLHKQMALADHDLHNIHEIEQAMQTWLAQNGNKVVAGLNDVNIVQGAIAAWASLQHSGKYIRPRGPLLQVLVEEPLAPAELATKMSIGLTLVSGLVNEGQIYSANRQGHTTSLQAGLDTGVNIATTAIGYGLIAALAASTAPEWAVALGAVGIGVGVTVAYAAVTSQIDSGGRSSFPQGAAQGINELNPLAP